MALAPIKEKYADLVEFFQWLIPLYLPNANMYLQGQSAPRPENPYVSFSPMSSIEVVGVDERRFEDSTTEILRGQRILTCELEGFSDSESRFDGNDNAWDMLQELRFALSYPEVIEKLTSINCRIVEEGVVSDSSLTLNTTNEPRAVWSFTVSTVIVQTIDSGAIETVNATGNIEATDGDIAVSVTAIKS